VYSATWPKQGMTRSGVAFAPPMSARRTDASGCSWSRGRACRDPASDLGEVGEVGMAPLALPTPTAHDGSSNGVSALTRQGGPTLLERVRLLPTPTAADAKNCTHRTQTGGPSLPDTARLLPTPTAADARSAAIQTVLNPGRPTPAGCVTLTDSVRLLPTPRATDGTKGCPAQRGSKGDLMLPSAIIRLLTQPATTHIEHARADDAS
jgi:hypothetical protein